MAEESDLSVENKTNFLYVLIGVGISAIIAIIFYYFRYSTFLGGIFYIFDSKYTYYFGLVFYFALPFIINFLVIKSFRNKDVKSGLKLGFILILLFVIYTIYLFVQPILSNYYDQKALATSNSDLCANVRNVIKRNDCYKTIAIKNNDSSLCDKMEGSNEVKGLEYLDYYKNECYSTIGYNKKDSSYCDKLSSSAAKDDCYNTARISSQDLTVCDKIQSQEKKDNCYNWAAKNKRDPSFFAKVCPLIKTQESHDDCYLWYAAYSKDWALCNNIQSQSTKDCCDRKEQCVQV